MWDNYAEGSIFDPLAFQPKPRKPENKFVKQQEKYRPQAYRKPERIEWNKLNPSKYVKSGVGLIKTYQKFTSPSYQLAKANRQLKDVELRKELMKVREKLSEEKRIISESQRADRNRTIDNIKQRLGIRQNVYNTNQRLPKANLEQDRLDETKERYTGKNRDRYLSDKEKYEKQ